MMIWIWIVLAVLLSWRVCKRHITWYHYIWMLLPIEMYGINVAGATFKPYMIYGILTIFIVLAKKKELKIPRAFGFAIFALCLSDLINGLIITSIMQHLMFLLILFIAFAYVEMQVGGIELNDISDVTIATTIGYGLVFSVATALFKSGYLLSGIFTIDRYSSGMILRFTSTGGIYASRLRGFCIDPNSVFTTLIPGAAFAFANILYIRKDVVKSVIAVFLYFIVVYQSGSRMGIICSILMVVIMFVLGYRETDKKKEWAISASLLVVLLMFFLAFRGRSFIDECVADVVNFFSTRATLFDDAGRFTIWLSNIKYLMENGRILFGVGQNQIFLLTAAGKACHNTWLEWICGTGIFIGLGMCAWFAFASKSIRRKCNDQKVDYIRFYLPIVLAYWTTLIAVTTVDNITNSIMCFLMVLFRYGSVKVNNK